MLASLSTKKKGIQSIPTSHIYLHTHYSEKLLKNYHHFSPIELFTKIRSNDYYNFHYHYFYLHYQLFLLLIFLFTLSTISTINISIYTINYFYY